jgi:ADP-ribose pyrophosphatase YjhB (NUDIX family)
MNLPINTIIASGPVIIEDGKVLLNRSKSTTDGKEREVFMFPGGKVENFTLPLEDTCKREVQEELGIDIKILRPLKTILAPRIDTDGYVVLVHYLAKRIGKVTGGEGTIEWQWFDIKNLPENITPNVREVITSYLNETI